MNVETYVESPFGLVLIRGNESWITEVGFMDDKKEIASDSVIPEILKNARTQMKEYFAGVRTTFDFPMYVEGTEFEKLVWSALQAIPFGETRSYGEIAKTIGRPKAARAVGMANHRNALGIVIPCHRVIGANGKLVGYASGVDKKEGLLAWERKVKLTGN